MWASLFRSGSECSPCWKQLLRVWVCSSNCPYFCRFFCIRTSASKKFRTFCKACLYFSLTGERETEGDKVFCFKVSLGVVGKTGIRALVLRRVGLNTLYILSVLRTSHPTWLQSSWRGGICSIWESTWVTEWQNWGKWAFWWIHVHDVIQKIQLLLRGTSVWVRHATSFRQPAPKKANSKLSKKLKEIISAMNGLASNIRQWVQTSLWQIKGRGCSHEHHLQWHWWGEQQLAAQ